METREQKALKARGSRIAVAAQQFWREADNMLAHLIGVRTNLRSTQTIRPQRPNSNASST
jgi:hypothetical protein